jgi:hypothetical protein
MNFKKYQGQIYKVELTPKEQKAMDEEINRQLIERHREFTDDFDYMVMKILHDHFGFGFTRLERFYDVFNKENETLIKHYEIPDAGVYVARKEMNALGVNIEKWNSERSE